MDREISVLLNTYFTFSNHVRDSNCCSALPFFSCTCSHTLAPCLPCSRWLMNVLDLSPHEFKERCGDHAKQSTVAASIHSTLAEARSQWKPRPTRKMQENRSLSREVTRYHEMSQAHLAKFHPLFLQRHVLLVDLHRLTPMLCNALDLPLCSVGIPILGGLQQVKLQLGFNGTWTKQT